MRPNLKTAGRYCIYTTVIGVVLSMIALIMVVSQSGHSQPSVVSAFFTYVAYWPLLLVGWSTHNLFVSFWVIPINVIGWCLIGFVFGLFRATEK